MTGVPLNIDWQQILLHLFNFTILFGALYILLYKPVKNFMASRETYYKDMDDRATAALNDAEAEKKTYEEKLGALEEEIRTEKAQARADIEALREKELEAAKQEAGVIISDAKAQAEKEKAEIVSSAQKEIRDIVTDAVGKLGSSESPSDAFDSFLDVANGKDSGR